jgi:hypothetical protein
MTQDKVDKSRIHKGKRWVGASCIVSVNFILYIHHVQGT